MLPFEVFVSDADEIFVVKSYIPEQIPVGVNILSINGKSASDIISEASPYFSYELKKFRNVKLERSFELCMYLIFGQDYALNVEYLGRDTMLSNVELMDVKEWKKVKKSDRDSKS